MIRHALSRTTLGVPGMVGALFLLAWLVGWALLGMHRGPLHLLMPVGLLLVLFQAVRRVNADGND